MNSRNSLLFALLWSVAVPMVAMENVQTEQTQLNELLATARQQEDDYKKKQAEAERMQAESRDALLNYTRSLLNALDQARKEKARLEQEFQQLNGAQQEVIENLKEKLATLQKNESALTSKLEEVTAQLKHYQDMTDHVQTIMSRYGCDKDQFSENLSAFDGLISEQAKKAAELNKLLLKYKQGQESWENLVAQHIRTYESYKNFWETFSSISVLTRNRTENTDGEITIAIPADKFKSLQT